jgi:hypothetical protein
MISVLLGSLFMLKEIMIGYKIVTIEVQCSWKIITKTFYINLKNSLLAK